MDSHHISTLHLRNYGSGMSIETSAAMRYSNKLLCIILAGTGLVTAPVSYADSHGNPNEPITPSMLTLNNVTTGKCTLSRGDNEQSTHSIALLLDAPCYWVTAQDTSTGEPLSYSYPEKNIDTVILVTGGELDWPDEKKTYHKLPIDSLCSQSLQGVIISDNEIYAVDALMEAPHCKGLAVDEKVFQQAVESEVRYKTTPPSLSSPETNTQAADTQEIDATASAVSETKIEPKEEDSLLGSIQKTIKRLFTKDD